MLINITAIFAIYLSCLILGPLVVTVPIGIGARIFKYEILPGSTANRWIFVIAGTVGALITHLIYSGFEISVPWWSFFGAAVIFIIGGSVPAATAAGRATSFGSATGILMFLALRWILPL